MASPVYAQIVINLGEAIGAGTDEEWVAAFGLPGTYKYIGGYLGSTGAVTASATNYATYSVELGGNEVSSEATTAADLGSISGGDVDALAVSGSGSDLECSQGEKISFKKTDAGTGAALGASSCVVLAFEQVRV